VGMGNEETREYYPHVSDIPPGEPGV
jgi:hypothetical protein